MSILLIILIAILLFGGGGFYGFRSGALNQGNLLYVVLFVVLILALFGYFGHGTMY